MLKEASLVQGILLFWYGLLVNQYEKAKCPVDKIKGSLIAWNWDEVATKMHLINWIDYCNKPAV